jgi:large subunit ribosomal protein L7A
LCAQRGVPVQDVRSMKELGTACGIEVGAATAAILKERA